MIFKKNYEATKDDAGISCKEPAAQQSFVKECDINEIMKKFEKTGILTDMIKENPQYGDFSAVPDYQQALELVSKAQEQFAALEGPIRGRFDNDPAKFLAFATDKTNGDELVKMGLATKAVVAGGDLPPPVTPPVVK